MLQRMPTGAPTDAGPVLAVNAGSTGVKLSLVDRDERSTPIADLAEAPGDLAAVGHRVVFGGDRLTVPALVDDALLDAIAGEGSVAPLHNGPALDRIAAARAALPGVPHVALFDTAFHAAMPEEARAYAVPSAWAERWDVRRHGFHGLSVEWATGRAATLLGRPLADLRLVVCHLGGGASATAVLGGRSVDTSMGFSPLEGLVMATRSGSLDPGIPLHLILHAGITPEEVRRMLNSESGMAAMAGTADMRDVEDRAAQGDARARRALAVHDHRLAGTIAGMAAALGGLDAVVFTGGVGEGSSRARAEAARRLAFLGTAVDEARNGAPDGDADVSAGGAAVRTLVVHAREDVVIARGARRVAACVGSPA